MKEVNQIELYIMYMINNIENIENRDVRKDIYGMFLIHQENCEVNDVFDHTNELDFKCPCQDIIKFLQKLNFHMQYKSLIAKQKPNDQGHNDDNSQMLEKEPLKSTTNKKKMLKSNKNQITIDNTKNKEEEKKEHHEIESH